ncbi:serine/threonine-protein kinase LMTK2 [Salmo trutta]|uniref:Serine/threonine-protein kinase LMTK2 n=1 Tax=Salmo trutta TaxID=8032 RepID=A0A673WG76_SALTR|nr:serine/threonine-protein kinase LMTK2-like [Salmo trutta]
MMGNRHGFVLLLATGIFLSALFLAEGAPLPYSDRTGETAGGQPSVSLHLSVVVSLTALLALVTLLVNCVTCCKEREVNFKEFEDNFEDEIDFTPPAEDTPSMQSPAEVYTLAVPPVALPGPPHLETPPRISVGSTGSQVVRHSLSYIQEIGNGWFGKVLLSEIYTDPGGAKVVVKELKANASAMEQNDFLQHGDPYRVLVHPNILQCLGQCVEAIPFLLVFEYCELGDLRSYLSQQDWMFRNAELLQLQKMACEIAAGVTHLHKHNFLHSDLALRNCYLTADLTVKVGDYGIGPYRYKEDYIITEDDESAPLRWMAPELVGERHGGVITLDQTKPGNVWALGVTLWELFENAAQPYPHLSDREVLNHVIREQQIKLLKPQLELPYSDRWYEVLQFCWLTPDKRATAEEIHRLLTYLRMQGQKDVEDDFQQRWDSLKPNPVTRQTTVSHSSYPILEQFADDALRAEVDEVLTVTETSRGLSFEYVWEAAKHDHYESNSGHGRSSMDTTLNYHSMFFPVPSEDIQAHFPDPAAPRTGGSNSRDTHSAIPGILPVFDAHKPANGNEYYIQLEEQGESTVEAKENRGPEVDTVSDRQKFVTLQDVRLDESSTDADFFHHSIDSKDSYLQDSHIWSSSEHDSPYHTNIFSEGDSRQDSHSWNRGFMELPELNGNGFQRVESVEGQAQGTEKCFRNSFLGERHSEVILQDSLEEAEGEGTPDVMRLLNTEKLADNFMFLKEKSLMKEGSGLSGKSSGSQQLDFLQPGLTHIPEHSFRMNSWDEETIDGVNIAEIPIKPVESNMSPAEELFDFMSPSFVDFLQPLADPKTLVPSNTLVTEDICSNQLPIRGLLQQSSNMRMDSASERAEVPVISSANIHQSPTLLSESATTDPLCMDAKNPSLEDCLGAPEDDCVESIGFKEPTDDLLSHGSPPVYVSEIAVDNGLTSEGFTSDDLLSDLVEDDTEADMDTALSEHEHDNEHDRSSLLVSGPSMDQISQDSLLEDSVSTTLPTVENSAETPDSLDNSHRLEGSVEELNTPAAPHKLQPPYKTADSGYETENLESPEWNSQPIIKDHFSEENGLSLAEEEEEEPAAATMLVPPDIIVSEVESVMDAQDGEDLQAEPIASGEESFMGGNYRDSAYFSDNESEPEKKSEEANSPTVDISGSVSGGPSVLPEVTEEEYVESSAGSQSPIAPEALVDIGVEKTKPQPLEGTSLPVLILTTEEDWAKTSPVSIDGSVDETGTLEFFPDFRTHSHSESSGTSTEDLEKPPLPAVATSAKPFPENIPVHAKLTRTYASEITPKLKEPDMEGRHLGRRDGSDEDGQEDGGEADEEDDNSDDSDDDMRAYRLHSSSEDSEDDTVHPVPVVVSDDSRARNLKSLLKPTSLNVTPSAKPSMPSGGSDADSTSRAVSFFDDVTVFLFDQETPTKELGDHSSGSNSQVAEFSSPVPTASYLNRFTNSTESSTDEEGGGFEWDDDFSSPEPSAFLSKAATDLAVSKTMSPSSTAPHYFSPPPPGGRTPEPSWSSSNYSRFSISPASIASFSLTHLTDSDTEQGGSSEEGDKD